MKLTESPKMSKKALISKIGFFLQTWNFTINKNKSINHEKEINITKNGTLAMNFFFRLGYNNKQVVLIPNIASTIVYNNRSKVEHFKFENLRPISGAENN